MKYLGIDYGSRNIGISISDSEGKIAFPRGVIANDEKLLNTLVHLIEAEKVECIVVGDTRGSSGSENPITQKAEEFAGKLAERASVPFQLVPEIWSSVEAGRFAEDHAHDDASAATVILQRFLDMGEHHIQ